MADLSKKAAPTPPLFEEDDACVEWWWWLVPPARPPPNSRGPPLPSRRFEYSLCVVGSGLALATQRTRFRSRSMLVVEVAYWSTRTMREHMLRPHSMSDSSASSSVRSSSRSESEAAMLYWSWQSTNVCPSICCCATTDAYRLSFRLAPPPGLAPPIGLPDWYDMSTWSTTAVGTDDVIDSSSYANRNRSSPVPAVVVPSS
mmetsp:Transcript_3816/g.4419  ORF Transcript_3816/g.4419 Transcript_3816/m.4419 type:complete len:201 (+) Transcript_3816:2031-2633(+)